MISALNLDMGINHLFKGSNDLYKYGNIEIQPLAYQDDVGSITKSLNETRSQTSKLVKLLKIKNLLAHPTKTGITILGKRKFITKTENEMVKNPIDFCKFKVNLKSNEKYLGQIFERNNKKSAFSTASMRAKKLKGAIFELKSIVEDYTMQNLAGLSSAWTLWESIMVPSLLSGAGTWIGNIENTIEVCNSVQNLFWRSILNVPKSCPKIALICETKMLDMKHRIWKEKISLFMRIKNLPNESLAKMIHEESMKNNWPGLGRDISQICNILKINNINYNHF